MAQAAEIAAKIERAREAFRRRPEAAMHEDAPAVARWAGGLQVVASHPNGQEVRTDMPVELGGGGEYGTGGWLLRSALASCLTTTIVMVAAVRGVALRSVEVRASSRSDARGLLGVPAPDGKRVDPGPHDLQLEVNVAADGVAQADLRALVEEADALSAISAAVRNGRLRPVRIEIG